uniref:Elongation of very long chain fatty acids protein 6 n=1 Tax=Lygus hesperus TaxID=30085 RepID=A0A0A9WBP7_LYGHE
MYFYFAMAEAGFKNLVKPFAMYITIMQLIQMIGVIFSSLYVIYYKYTDRSDYNGDSSMKVCSGTSMSNARLQLVIYTFFLYLFGKMFVDNHMCANKKEEANKKVL